ncbi:hypothetical protein B0O80DRAFT_108168 [Mortierella sp. GBAus27b]|nr:hypothetical protein BGX31_002144 [Mortierella sp. GBA43]KAI8351566.1 hypothetical protein B0O80DRAFT_108168 [Mortierella sp. GBAus27b]
MTRAASNRKQGTGSAAGGSRPGPVFRGRDVVFVDPLDEKESYWWPAMIVPVPEIDSTMECTVLNPGECLVKYFEDNKYSVVNFTDLQPFVPTTVPFLGFEEAAGQKFLKNDGVVNALAYLKSNKVKRKFSWNRWGTAQDQELSLDMNKHKPINLPLVSDEEFMELQQPSSRADSSFSSASSSPTTSTRSYSDSNDVDVRDRPSSSSSASTVSTIHTHTRHGSNGGLKNGLQRPLSGTTSQGSSTLLPSPVSLDDLTESMDESELNNRMNKTKDTPAGTTRSRSRRGSREVDTKTALAVGTVEKDPSKRSRNANETSSALSPTLTGPSSTMHPTQPSDSSTSETKRRKTTSEPTSATELPSVPEMDAAPGRRPSQGSIDGNSSQRSTRHSVRNSKATEGEDSTIESVQETFQPTRFQTQRMTRQRSAPKSVNSLPPLLPPSPPVREKSGDIKDEVMGSPSTGETEQANALKVEPKDQNEEATKSEQETGTAMDIDMPEASTEQEMSSVPSSTSSNVTSTASSSSSPASIEPDEGVASSSLPTSSVTNGFLQSLEQERREMDYSFEHVLPTLPIGSKEREAFYETCMDHLQKLRQEHRRLKEILKNSDYTPKGRRATRSSPQYHANQRHYLEDKSHRRHSPVPSRNNSSSSTASSWSANGLNGSGKEANGGHKSNSSKADAMAADASAASGLQGSTLSSAILASNISTSTRRSAATAAAAAVSATVSRSSRQNYGGSGAMDKGADSGFSKKRASAAAAAAAIAINDAGGPGMNTRPKRRQR